MVNLEDMNIKIENYYLNQPVREAPNLKEFTDEEYQIFELTGCKRMSQDEKIYYGQPINFNDNLWDTVIGVNNGKIYKISLQIMNQDDNLVRTVFDSTLNYLKKKLGKHSCHPFLSKKYIWDYNDENVFLNHVNKFSYHAINLIFTCFSLIEN